ncbi:sensor histidine kinase [Bacillus sp. RAR_GA_16]|uniref:sensor histidine kinase n=1 Tax=Bacillus sp. RAR_GA_16 TaxID=2876774 RepID=UPI001CD02E9A|nr:sensor histidine kinase [Bacillus sp. RAR_GA_16]MCA0173595.1 sensor histidine kinase [Bacillus sp. RAR_GA_16]
MSVIQRHMFIGALLSLLLLSLFTLAYLSVYPIASLSLLFEKDLMDLPFGLIVPIIAILFGGAAGGVSGLYVSKELQYVADTLEELDKGRTIHNKNSSSLNGIFEQINKLQSRMNEQVRLAQKLANEKAEDHEKRVQQVVSEERNRLARELHDSVSQQLFAASMLMSAITETRDETDNQETKHLKMVEETIHQSQLEMRALLLHLRPAALKDRSLEEGIKELLNELSQKVPIKVNWKLETLELDKGVEDHLFRIVQECVSNTLRHARASTLDVLLIRREGRTILRIVDDGIGFKMDEQKAASYGLQNMNERALEIGGVLKLVSLPQKGTRLEVSVPHVEGGTK